MFCCCWCKTIHPSTEQVKCSRISKNTLVSQLPRWCIIQPTHWCSKKRNKVHLHAPASFYGGCQATKVCWMASGGSVTKNGSRIPPKQSTSIISAKWAGVCALCEQTCICLYWNQSRERKSAPVSSSQPQQQLHTAGNRILTHIERRFRLKIFKILYNWLILH